MILRMLREAISTKEIVTIWDSDDASETYRVLKVQEAWVHLQVVKSMDDLFLRTRHIRGIRWRSAHEERSAQINP